MASCVCGSDLWPYRGVRPVKEPTRIGHEFVGVVEAVGSDVRTVRAGDFVIAPFALSDGTCPHCRNGIHTSCEHGEWWGGEDGNGFMIDGGQGEYVRVAMADGTLVATPEMPDDAMVPSLLTLSDVMGTGHHAARSAGVGPGQTVVVVGDGAVGLCAVLAARRLGAERVIAMSRHADRQSVAREFGADVIVEERGDEGAARIEELTAGVGADAVLECVGTKESMAQAIGSARPGGRVGYVGVPAGGAGAADRHPVLLQRGRGRWGGAGSGVHPRAPRRRVGGQDRSRQGVRPDVRTGRGGRRLPRHGRAHRDQGPADAVSALRLRRTSDAGQFLERTGAFLRSRPIEHSVLLSVPAQWVDVDSEAARANWWLWVEDGDDVVAAAIQTPPHGVGVSPAPDHALRLLASELYAHRPGLPSVSGVRHAARDVRRGLAPARRACAQGRHGPGRSTWPTRCEPPAGVPGRLRQASTSDADLLRQWARGFYDDTGAVHDDRDTIGPKVEAGVLFVWEVDGQPVSMVAHSAAEGGITRVSLVYTPPSLRGNGYASAVVAALTARELAHPGRQCMLYTDLANPTSNKIYQAIGYRRVGEAVTLSFA